MEIPPVTLFNNLVVTIMKHKQRPLLYPAAALLLAGLLTACDNGKNSAALAGHPVNIDPGTSCSLDGMILADYAGPKAQIHYDGQSRPDFFCDTVEMFNIWHNPEQARRILAIYVQDMGKTSWEKPDGHWIDAKAAFYVHGSRLHGSMGPTIASFASENDARKFAETNGGTVLRFDQVTDDMSALDGGALHDHSM